MVPCQTRAVPGPTGRARRSSSLARGLVIAALVAATGCRGASDPQATEGQTASRAARPSILLVTLDTTRFDAIGPNASGGVSSPAFNAIAARGRRFLQAYATVPETLPSHASIMSGLYPAGHGIHENARTVAAAHDLLAERLASAGYSTSAYVSSFVLARRFGLAAGFDRYDDTFTDGAVERTALETTTRVADDWKPEPGRPAFLWVHYFDPHAPYTPPDALKMRYARSPYHGEVAAMDEQLGRLVELFEQRASGPHAIIVVADHGEGLGDHGEAQHGNLLYQSTMHVPLVIVGPDVEAGVSDVAVSARQVFYTALDFAGLGDDQSLRRHAGGVVLGEAMKPFLEYGWQPQIMAVEGRTKAITAGRIEVYDVAADPREAANLWRAQDVPLSLRKALDDYPVPSASEAVTPQNLSDEARRNLASLGYVGATASPVVRRDAPRPADMVDWFEDLDRASGLFVREQYAQAVPLYEEILEADPHNLDAMLRLATSHSALGHEARAVALFTRAAQAAPASPDVRLYTALHFAKGTEWLKAVPLLEQAVSAMPDRLPALEALATLRERERRFGDAIVLRQRIAALRDTSPAESVHLGTIAMEGGQTDVAIAAFERARARQGAVFAHDLELGALYLSARKFPEARDALDRVRPTRATQAMLLFKRAQVSVLLGEPDRAQRIDAARRGADATTRDLVARERLFQPDAR